MKEFLSSQLDNGEVNFTCPICKGLSNRTCSAAWNYRAIRHVVATESDIEEMIIFDVKFIENQTQTRRSLSNVQVLLSSSNGHRSTKSESSNVSTMLLKIRP